MFSTFMTDTWIVATVVALIAGVVGCFVVIRGSVFAAHSIPNGAFAGAAGANVLGFNRLLGLGSCAVLAAVGIGAMGRRGRRDTVTALALVMMLAVGAAFLSRSGEYEPKLFALLFGDLFGVTSGDIAPILGLAAASVAAVAFMHRPLLLSAVVPEVAESKGLRGHRVEIIFLVVVGLATAMTVPVVGALLIFSLMVGPPAAAMCITSRPAMAILLSVGLALATVWTSIAASYSTDWPPGFFVGTIGAALYSMGRLWVWVRQRG